MSTQPSLLTVYTKHAFSLIELSIVLVILGLLAGGVLSGQSLIRAAELRSVNTEYQRHVTSVQTFRDKYQALPGDMPNATAFWQAAADCAVAATDKRTCNGNGDGIIVPLAGKPNESFRAWQHLANAGLIEGTYSGIQQGATLQSATEANSPRSRLPQGLWFVWNWQTTFSTAANTNNDNVFDGDYFDNFLQIGKQAPDSSPGAPIFKPEEIWNIDTKMDDGKPATGNIKIRQWPDCTMKPDGTAATSASLDAVYKLSETGVKCSAIFLNVF